MRRVNHSAYDETVVHYERRFANRDSFQVNYVLSWANGMAGDGDGTLRGVPYYLYPVDSVANGRRHLRALGVGSDASTMNGTGSRLSACSTFRSRSKWLPL